MTTAHTSRFLTCLTISGFVKARFVSNAKSDIYSFAGTSRTSVAKEPFSKKYLKVELMA